MNIRCTINPSEVLKYDFKHLLSYRILIYMLTYCDDKTFIIYMDKWNVIKKLYTNHHTYDASIAELIDLGIISKANEAKDYYKINSNIVVSAFNVPEL